MPKDVVFRTVQGDGLKIEWLFPSDPSRNNNSIRPHAMRDGIDVELVNDMFWESEGDFDRTWWFIKPSNNLSPGVWFVYFKIHSVSDQGVWPEEYYIRWEIAPKAVEEVI